MKEYHREDDYDIAGMIRSQDTLSVVALPDEESGVQLFSAKKRTPIFRVKGYIQTNGSLNRFQMSRIRMAKNEKTAVTDASNGDSFCAESVEQICFQGQPLYLVTDVGRKDFRVGRKD